MPVHRVLSAFVVLIAVVPTPIGRAAFASSESHVGVLQLDASRTLVEFRLGGALHTTHGKFQLKSGTIKADSSTGKAEGVIVIDAASGDSGDLLRDSRMKDSVLEAEKYPEISFSPRHIDGHLNARGSFKAKLEGLLKLHGADHEITIDTQGTLIDANLVATGHFVIPYVEWGLRDPSVLFLTVAKEVDIGIATAGRLTWLSSENGAKTSSHRPRALP